MPSGPTPARPRHRRLLVLRGSPATTRATAEELCAGLHPEAVAWIGLGEGPPGMSAVPPRAVATMLGRSFDAVVVDAHAGVDPDVLGQSHGLVRGGGGFVLRLAPPGQGRSRDARARLAAFPFGPEAVGRRFDAHLERALARASVSVPHPLTSPPPPRRGHDEQARVVARLLEIFACDEPTRTALLADRGRGKSSALGLALRDARSDLRVAITAPRSDAAAEVFRFGLGSTDVPQGGRICFVSLPQLVFGEDRYDLVIVDEAAQLPVPMLRQLVRTHADAHLVLCSTTHGYEGTGRGFSLRFLAGLERGPVPVERLTLRQPIRWDAGDPLERFTFDALLLDAEPARIPHADVDPDALRAVRLDRDALLADESRLRELFGLLVHAHYRTTPADLHRLLDAPNLGVHALLLREHIVAATIVADEGGLSSEHCDAMLHGRLRIRAHALPDALVSHLGKRHAGSLHMLRSVRIATHPQLRRHGLATRLVEHVHREHAPDLFGTLFGATPELLAFRRRVGYRLVRVGASQGARTGEPSVMMLRPVTSEARALVHELRSELARDLPRQLELMQADGETLLDPALKRALTADLPPPAPMSADTCRTLVEAYAHGPRTFESIAVALRRFASEHPRALAALDLPERALIEGRVLAGHGWRRVARDSGHPSVTAAMRALRRATRTLLAMADDPRQ